MVEKTGDFTLTSPSFKDGEMIPKKHSYKEGPNIIPALHWSNPPPGTKSFALICDDPDAPMGTWTHWLVKDIPATATGVEEGGKIGTEIQNHFGFTNYGGPAPPSGTHRYYFKLYALNVEKMASKTKEEMYTEVEGKRLGKAQIMGKYSHGGAGSP